jgi:ribonuclease BN (tRNA processing enzyme)
LSLRVTILGSGTLLPDDRRRSPGHLVEGPRAGILLDCGSGTLHGLEREGKDWFGITHVVLSHFHTDHTGDLAPLLWAWKNGGGDRPAPDRVLLGPSGLERVMKAMADAFGDHVFEPGGHLDLVELEGEARWDDLRCGLTLRCRPTPHTPESVAWRVETEEGTVGYSGDTGPSAELGAFFRDVDLLIAECALPDEKATAGHLTPRSAAELAVAADPGALVLTHFYPGVDTARLPDLIRAGGYTGAVHAGYDGLGIDVPQP